MFICGKSVKSFVKDNKSRYFPVYTRNLVITNRNYVTHSLSVCIVVPIKK